VSKTQNHQLKLLPASFHKELIQIFKHLPVKKLLAAALQILASVIHVQDTTTSKLGTLKLLDWLELLPHLPSQDITHV
jgi:hypothetical protein